LIQLPELSGATRPLAGKKQKLGMENSLIYSRLESVIDHPKTYFIEHLPE
jgi:hypothetical protein